MEYHFRAHKEGDGYWAACVELKGCVSQGQTLQELKRNVKEALDLYLDEPEDSRVLFPLPRRHVRGKRIIAVPVDPQIALALLLRMERLKKGLSQKEAAVRLGVPLYSYQRLEHAKTANPEWKTLVKLLRVFPHLMLRQAAA